MQEENNQSLTYEETPVIEPPPSAEPPPAPDPVPAETPPAPAPPPTPETKSRPAGKSFFRRFLGMLGTLLIFALLFGAGVFLSGILRDYLNAPATEETAVIPTPTPVSILPAGSATPSATPAATGWTAYAVISGVTRVAIPGISLSLPSDLAAPTCDGSSCSSQGTYLSGGTRLTIAPRGAGQVLKDFRGSIISDLQGQAFTVTQTTVAGRNAVAFEADFTGSTAGGSTFSRMRGVMIEVTPTLSLELNHFTPTGTTADFASDDAVFNQILSRVSFSSTSSGAMTK